MSTLTLEQFEQLIATNVLIDPPMWVRNSSYPKGQVAFNVLGSDFKMRDIIIPVQGNAVDLTLYAPLQNLLASSELRAIFATKHLTLVNPGDMPEPVDPIVPFPEGSISVTTPIYTDATSVAGAAPVGTQVQLINGGKIVAVIAAGNSYSIPVDGLVAGSLEVTFIKTGFTTTSIVAEVVERPAEDFPIPALNEYFYYGAAIEGTTLPETLVTLFRDGVEIDSTISDESGDFTLETGGVDGTFVLHFEKDGYNELELPVVKALNQVNVNLNIPYLLDTQVLIAFLNAQPVPVNVELEIEGQPSLVVEVPANAPGITVGVLPVTGKVKATIQNTGYEQRFKEATPEKNNFTALVFTAPMAGTTTVGGTQPLKAGANDVEIEIVTLQKTYTDIVNNEGIFVVPTDALEAGEASLKFTSAFYNDLVVPFTVELNPIPDAIFDPVYAGDTAINGTTIAEANIEYAGGSSNADTDGKFSVAANPPVPQTGSINVLVSKEYYSARTFEIQILPLQEQIDPTNEIVYVGETEISGEAEPDAQIFIGGSDVGDVSSSGAWSLSGSTVTEPIEIVFRKRGYVDATLTVTPTPLQTISKPAGNPHEEDTQFVGTTIPNATITCDKAPATTSDVDGNFTLTFTVPLALGDSFNITIAKRGYTTATFPYNAIASE